MHCVVKIVIVFVQILTSVPSSVHVNRNALTLKGPLNARVMMALILWRTQPAKVLLSNIG